MRMLPRLSAIVLAAVTAASFAAPPHNEELAGHYYLHGATDVGSELVLGKDGKFEWMLSYGAQDQAAQGTWQVKEQQVVLSATSSPLAFRLFTDDELSLKKPPKAGTWVAIVGVPKMGPVADVEVKFEAKSGKSAIAISAQNGDAIVTMADGEHWIRAGLRRSKSQEAWQWVPVPAERAAARIAGFAVTNPQAIEMAFKTMALKMEKGGLTLAETGLRGVYVKRP